MSIVIMLKLGFTIPNLSNNCLHKPTNTEIYPITEADKDLMEKNREDVVCGSIVLTRKTVAGDTFVRKSTILCNSLLRLMPANYWPTRCVKTCRLVFMRVETSLQSRTDSGLDKRKPVDSKIWSCLIFNQQVQNRTLKISTEQADKTKLIVSVLMDFVLNATLCLTPCVASIIFSLPRNTSTSH